jgi:hypothetical protein
MPARNYPTARFSTRSHSDHVNTPLVEGLRIRRLKYLSRNRPDAPASIELDSLEIDAVRVERKSRYPGKLGHRPELFTIGEATKWIAETGGWMGQKSSFFGTAVSTRKRCMPGSTVEVALLGLLESDRRWPWSGPTAATSWITGSRPRARNHHHYSTLRSVFEGTCKAATA